MQKKTRTILVAEDDPLVRKTTVYYLTGKGYSVLEASNGKQALQQFREKKPDMLLTDLRMPELDGMDLVQTVVEEDPSLPVIILSGMGTMTDVIEALRIGAWDYLTKPIANFEILNHSINKAWQHAKLFRQANDYQISLEKQVQQRTAELLQQNLQLEQEIKERKRAEHEKEKVQFRLLHAQKLESVGQLAAGIAHEINTPAQFIGINIDFLEGANRDINEFMNHIQEIVKNAPPEISSAVHTAMEEMDWEYLAEEIPLSISQSHEGVKRVTSIIRAMKEFSHPGSKEKTLQNLNDIINTTITVARNEWRYVAEMNLDLEPELPRVPLLTDEIGQVILNILVNAAHAIAEKLGPDPDDSKGTINIITRKNKNNVELLIHDTGAGMVEKVRLRIFDPFYTTKKVGKGTGQGLAISHDVIVEKHQGTIAVESIPDEGTTFIIRLPLQGEKTDD